MITFFGAVVEDYLMMVMELCERGSLYDVLTKTPKELSWKRAVDFASDMAEGISVLHQHQPPIIHRDMKSLNLLVTKDWRCKVCDFGLSRLQKDDSMGTMQRLVGTFHFAGPEVFQGKPATNKFDVFSMGIVLWELMATVATGSYKQPYEEYNFTMDYQVIVQTSQGLRPSIPKGCQFDFVDLFDDCVSGIPEERPTAQEVAKTIKEWKKELATSPEKWKSRVVTEARDGRGLVIEVPQQMTQPSNKSKFSGWKK